MKRKEYIALNMKQKREWLMENTKYQIALMILKGSQNYDMDEYTEDYKSNFHIVSFVVPTLKDLLENPHFLKEDFLLDDESVVQVRDIRYFLQYINEMNPVALELLFSHYFITNDDYHRLDTLIFYKKLKTMREDIENANVSALLKQLNHEIQEDYQNLIPKKPKKNLESVEVCGYSPKRLHHISRNAEMIKEIIRLGGKVDYPTLIHYSFLTKQKKDMIKNYKINPVDVSEAMHTSKKYIEDTQNLLNTFLKENSLQVQEEVFKKVESIFDDYINVCVKKDVIQEVKAMNNKKK